MAEPFARRPSSGASLAARIVGRRAGRTAVRELEALLARARRVRDVSLDRVQRLSDTHGIDLRERLRTPRRNLYRRFLEHCLLDCTLTEEEADELAHLRKLLYLADADVAHVHDAVSRAVYGAALEDVLDDYKLDEDEERFLQRLRGELGMSEVDASRMYEEESRRAQQRLLSSSLSRGIVASRQGVVELNGASTVGLQDAIQSVVDSSSHALPHLSWAELSEVRVRIESGRVAEWQIKLKAGLAPPPTASDTAAPESSSGAPAQRADSAPSTDSSPGT